MQNTWFDSHCHLDLPAFEGDRESLWRQASNLGVAGALIPGLEPSQWSSARACAASLGKASAWAVGLHPWWIDRQSESFTLEMLTEALAAHVSTPGCIAIGECGLDGAIALPLQGQIPWLDCQLAFARERGLPVILHQHKAHNPLIQVLNRHPGLQGLVHGFSGSLAMAQDYTSRGLLLGIGGVVTYPRAKKTRAAVAALPATSFILETDAPSMPVNGRQGQVNRPEDLLTVAQAVADLREVSLAQLATEMRTNGQRLFGF